MVPRERILTALDHQEPDRVPCDCGGRQTTFMVQAYENLKEYLGFQHLRTNLMSAIWQTVYVDEEILERFSIDCRHVRPPKKHLDTFSILDTHEEQPSSEARTFTDEWGIQRKLEHGYTSITHYPLQNASLVELEKYPWPRPKNVYDFSKIKKNAADVHQQGTFACVGCMGSPGNIFEQSWYLRGFSEFLLDLVDNKDFAHALMSKILEIRKENVKLFLQETGPYLDIFQLADDLGMQASPLMSPSLYREMLKPYHQELIQCVKEYTAAKIYFHSCGSVAPLLDDFIDIGIDILNPVQVSAKGMSSDQLKKRFGNSLSFWGGIDTTEVLPQGSVSQVHQEVQQRIEDLGPGGGYVVASVHNMQSDIPPENIVALYEAASKYGMYPLQK